MERKTETVVLILIIAALTAYLVLKKKEKTHYRLPELPGFAKEDVTRLTIRKGGLEIVLKRDGDRWRILPEGYPVDETAMDRMLDTIVNLRLTAVASSSENYAVYDLQEGERLDVSAFKGKDLLLSISIGKTAPSHRHTFVKLAQDSRVYHAEKNFRSYFDKEAGVLRDKQVLKIDEEISEVILTADGKDLHIVKTAAREAGDGNPEKGDAGEEQAGEDTLKWGTPDGKRVQEKEIDGLVKTVSNLKCESFLKEKKSDLGDPSFEVSLKGTGNYELALYGEREGKTVAASSQNDDPFLIPDWKAKRIRKDLDELVEKSD